jgi:hypothetical protein
LEETFDILRNRIDISRVPFSDRGSRILVYQQGAQPRLTLRLAERLLDLQPGLEIHRTRPALIPDLRFIDGDNQPLPFRLITEPHALTFETRLGKFKIVFHDDNTLAIGLPRDERAGIEFEVASPLWTPLARGGLLTERRNLAYQCTCPLEQNRQGNLIQLIGDAGDDDAIHLMVRSDLDLPCCAVPFSQSYAQAESRWASWFSTLPEVLPPYRETYFYAWWILANNMVSPRGFLRYQAAFPSKAYYLGVWNWDACFHAVALRHNNPQLARDQLRAMIAAQRPNGMIPDVVHDEGIVNWIDHPIPGKVTKPPVLAWAALKIDEIDPNPDFLAEIYPAIVRWHDWYFTHADGETGLAEYTHPYTSGMDDSPMWDHGFPVTAPDLNTYLYLQRQSLATMADRLGEVEEAASWRERAADLLEAMIEHLYDSEAGLFHARHDGEPIPERTLVNLYPLLTGRLPAEIEARLVEHLTNPASFWLTHPLASVAGDTPSFDADTMWRGPTWINTNYFFIDALARYGHAELAAELRAKTLALVMQSNDIYEYYSPHNGEPPSGAAPMYSWSAALFIDLAIQASEDGNSSNSFANHAKGV